MPLVDAFCELLLSVTQFLNLLYNGVRVEDSEDLIMDEDGEGARGLRTMEGSRHK